MDGNTVNQFYHFLTMARLRAQISIVKTVQGQRSTKYNLQKLKEPKICELYMIKIN